MFTGVHISNGFLRAAETRPLCTESPSPYGQDKLERRPMSNPAEHLAIGLLLGVNPYGHLSVVAPWQDVAWNVGEGG